MKIREEYKWTYIIGVFTILTAVWVIMAFTGQWIWKDNPYNSYILQAQSWLEGRLDLGKNYEYLELAIYGGKYYVSFPPFPSFVMLPFVLIFGSNFHDGYIALATTILGIIYALRMYIRANKAEKNALFYILFVYIGCGALFFCINGYVWFIAQNMCLTLSFMSLTYSIEGKSGRSLFFWACAVGCRPMIGFYLPLLLFILWKSQGKNKNIKEIIKKNWHAAIGPCVMAGIYMGLNFARFGNVMEFGHNYLPEFTRTQTGQFNILYFLDNIKKLFALPKAGVMENGGLEFPTIDGITFWIAIPLFISIFLAWLYSIIKKRQENIFTIIVIPILFLVHVFVICCHRTLGGWQFGSRYMFDTLPYLLYGFINWKPASDLFNKINIPLFCLGALVNTVGTVAVYNNWI